MEKEGRPWNFKTGQGVVKYDKFDALRSWEHGDAIKCDETWQRVVLERGGQSLVSVDIYLVMPSRMLDI